jgi:hypothetical protein
LWNTGEPAAERKTPMGVEIIPATEATLAYDSFAGS